MAEFKMDTSASNGRIEPDIEELLAVIRRSSMPKRVHHIELFLDEEIKQLICERFEIRAKIDSGSEFADVSREIELHRFLGYDAFRVGLRSAEIWTLPTMATDDTTHAAGQKRGERNWMNEHTGPVQSWEDFEKYPWPSISNVDFSNFEWLNKNLPENMGCYDLTAHILEIVTWLFGYETLCLKLFDDSELVEAVCERVGQFYVELTKTYCDFSCIKVVWGSDDMGYRTATMLSPDFLRRNILPWHKKCAEIAHEHGLMYLLHSCGNIEEIMDDLIDDVGIDARHSYEDVIMPVTEVKKKYGEQIAILGGIDMDFLCRADEKAVRKRVKETLELCMPGGGYCLGTGNSVANYIPLNNYLAMLDEGRKFAL
jgi:uroporphyrinogen decarboxylase